jgi:hypothetical protein
VADTAKKRADEARRLEELHQRQAEYERKQNREIVKRSAEMEQRLVDLERSSSEHKSRQEKRVRSRREVVANIKVGRKSVYVVGSLGLSESFHKRKRVVSGSGDERERDGACLASTLATASVPVVSGAIPAGGAGGAAGAAGGGAGGGAAGGRCWCRCWCWW